MTGFPRPFLLVLLLTGYLSSAPVLGADAGASALTTQFQKDLLQVMKRAETLGVAGRSAELQPVIEDTFHLPLMLATSAGDYWRGSKPNQRARLLKAYTKMSISTLASLFHNYSGETFETLRQRKASKRTVLVDTRINRPNDDPVNITYVLDRIKGRWWIIDVIVAGGISEVTVRRSEYTLILSKDGVEGLIEALQKKTDQMIASAKSDGN